MNRILMALRRSFWLNAFVAGAGLLSGTACVSQETGGTDGQSGFVEGSKPTSHEGPLLLAKEGVPEVLLGEMKLSTFDCGEDDEEPEAIELQVVLQRDGTELSGQIWGLGSRSAGAVSGTTVPADAELSASQVSLPNGAAYDLALTELDIGSDKITAVLELQEFEQFGGTDTLYSCAWEGEVVFTPDQEVSVAQVRESVGGYSALSLEFGEPVHSGVVVEVKFDGESLAVSRTDTGMEDLEGFLRSVQLVPEKPWPAGELTVVVRDMTDVAGNTTDAEVLAIVPEYQPANADLSYESESRDGNPWWLAPDCKAAVSKSERSTEGDSLLFLDCTQNGLLFQQRVDVPGSATRVLIDVSANIVNEMQLRLRSGTGEVELSTQSDDAGAGLSSLETYSAALDEELGTALWLTVEIEFDYGGEPYLEGYLSLDNLRFE